MKLFKYFHYMTNMAMPQHKKSFPRSHEIYNFVRLFLAYHNYRSVPRRREEEFIRNQAFSLSDFFGHAQAQGPASLGVIQVYYNSLDVSTIYRYQYLLCLIYSQEQSGLLKKLCLFTICLTWLRQSKRTSASRTMELTILVE